MLKSYIYGSNHEIVLYHLSFTSSPIESIYTQLKVFYVKKKIVSVNVTAIFKISAPAIQ